MSIVKLIEQMQSGILFEDPEGRIIKVNQYFCDLFKIFLSPMELNGKETRRVTNIMCDYLVADSDDYISLINKRLKDDIAVTGDEIFLKDGRVLSRDYVPVKDDRELTGHLWQFSDITKTKLKEKYYNLQNELGFSLASASNLKQALKHVLNSVNAIGAIHGAAIYLLNPENGCMEIVIHSGFSEELIKKIERYNSGESQFDLIMKGNPVYGYVEDVFWNSEVLEKNHFFQIGVIPVKNDGRVIGSVNIASMESEAFSDDVKNLLESVVAQIGGAIARIKARNEILLNRKNFQMLFETIDDFVMVLDTDWKIIRTNKVFMTKLNYLQEDLQGKHILTIFPKEQSSSVSEILDAVKSGLAKSISFPFCAKDKSLLPVETIVIRGHWDGKDVLYAISRDQSEKRIAEKELKRSELRWQYALENSVDGVWDWEFDTDKVFFSKQWLRMFGYNNGDISGSREEWERLIHPDDIAGMKNNIELHFKCEIPVYRNVHRILCKDNVYKWVIDRGKIIAWNDSGSPERMIGTTTDVSKMKENENSLEAALRKEKELNALKSRFVSQTSHEFRTPLSTMLIAAESLEAYYDEMTENKREQKISRIKNNIIYLKGVIEKVLDLSHLECGKMKLTKEKLELNEFIDNVVMENIEMANYQHNIEFKRYHVPVWINIDKQMLRQVINNMISNSCKYSPVWTTITISLCMAGTNVLISIEDRGIGIPEEDEEKIFEPFYRGVNVGEVRGTGLGLSLAMQFVKVHNGNITYTPGKNGGTVFTVKIPVVTD
ncbi:MAG: PAS domain S-box protein [Prolixibacteraceae bacterium]|nr:PAS domain S-box protein [Prolixibacteraceae bacterium]